MSSTQDTDSATSTPTSDTPNCGSVNNEVDFFNLRIVSLFVILAVSLLGALFPVLARRSKYLNVPPAVFDFAKYFGSGVIIATAFIHLLSPALDALGSKCLPGVWGTYPWALAIAMISVFGIFFLELFAFRWGSAKLASLGVKAYDPHGHHLGSKGAHSAHGPEMPPEEKVPSQEELENGVVTQPQGLLIDSATAQILGIAILEFGIVFHSVLIGMTLAVDPDFKVLFVVLVFHQGFEGLGLGARLAYMALPPDHNWVPVVGAILYGVTTPVGIAAGLGIRTTYNPESTTASIVSGLFDSISAGILLYAGLVELLAHEFLFNPSMSRASNTHLGFASVSMLAGAGIMALLGRWA